jgi:myo-inositol 2-dehydrogenase/D-chiro-inositol 1-dehydrogenase
MKVLYAAYASAGEGRKIQIPFSAKGVQKPIDLWFRGPQYRPHAVRK